MQFLYNSTDLGIWSLAEVGISIMCIAMATLRPLMHKSFFKNPSQRGTSGTNTYQHSQIRSGSNWPSGNGGIGSPRGGNDEYYGGVRSDRKGVRPNEEDIGMAMGYSDDDVELKTPHRAITREQVRFGTTTYVQAGTNVQERELVKSDSRQWSSSEEVDNADFVYGRGIRATTTVTTKRE